MVMKDVNRPNFQGFFARPDDWISQCCGECITKQQEEGSQPFFSAYWWQWMMNPSPEIMKKKGDNAEMVFIQCQHK